MKRYILAPIRVGQEVIRDVLVEGETYNGGTVAHVKDGVVEIQKGYRIERYMVASVIRRELPDEEFVIPYAQPFEIVERSSWRCAV